MIGSGRETGCRLVVEEKQDIKWLPNVQICHETKFWMRIFMGECNSILSAYTMYRHLE